MTEFASTIAMILEIACGALPAPAVCTCMVGRSGGEPTEVVWSQRDVIFVGNALEVSSEVDDTTHQRVRFLVEASWRGELADTVTLAVGDNSPCATYMAGGRYLVLADQRSAEGAPLTSATCDLSWVVWYPRATEMMNELGPPRRSSRGSTLSGDPLTGAILVGQAPQPAVDTVAVGMGFQTDDRPARFRVGDRDWIDGERTAVLRLPTGAYQVQAEWRDGERLEFYMSVKCETMTSGMCYAHRYFTGLRVPIRSAG